MPITALDDCMLQAALEGLKLRREQVEQRIAELRRRLRSGNQPERVTMPATPARAQKRYVSTAARRRMAAAQRRRWVAYRRQKAAQESKAA